MPEVRVDRRGLFLAVCMCLLFGIDLMVGLMYGLAWGLGKAPGTMVLGLISGAATVALMPVVLLFHIFYRCPICRMRLQRQRSEQASYRCPQCQVDWVTGWSENPPPP